jgi:UDP-N-acetylmuramyl pentapeptide phosphotransferase/UDP-N-acetylglucosamine-1-phosphate transferase
MAAPVMALWALGCGIASALTVFLLRALARHRSLLDLPNQRSAHTIPTPRLGGLGIVLVFLGAAAFWTGLGPSAGAGSLLAAVAVVALVGLVDDLRALPARARFACHLAAAVFVVWDRWDSVSTAVDLLRFPVWLLGPAMVLWMVWMTNLNNFMDGIDGLAAGQAVLASLGLGVGALASGVGGAGALLLFLAAASAGFLWFNFPPASIFMGDAGATAIGLFLAGAPLLAGGRGVSVESVWIATGLFVLDATTTLLRRVAAGERWFEAHRSHWYQRPLRFGVSHRTIDLTAWSGMFVLAAASACYPLAPPVLRTALLFLPVAVFLPMVLAVRRLERRHATGAEARSA